ncbi:MAG: hypothetical protein ACRDWT_14890, partial [Jatrophihabitantaceae bacterium]
RLVPMALRGRRVGVKMIGGAAGQRRRFLGTQGPLISPKLRALRRSGRLTPSSAKCCRRLIKRMPKAKTLDALERSILVIVFHLLASPTTKFTDLGPDFTLDASTATAASDSSPANFRPSATP